MFKNRHYPLWENKPYALSKISSETDGGSDVYLLLAPAPHRMNPNADILVWTGKISVSAYVVNPLRLLNPTLNHQGFNYTSDTTPPSLLGSDPSSVDDFYESVIRYGANPDLMTGFANATANFAELFQLEPEVTLTDYWFAGVKAIGDYVDGESSEEAFARLLSDNPAMESAINYMLAGDFTIGIQRGVRNFEHELPELLGDRKHESKVEDKAIANLLHKKVMSFASDADHECAQGFIHVCDKGKRGVNSLYKTIREQYIADKEYLPVEAARSLEDYIAFLKAYGVERDIEQVIGYANNGFITVEWGREGSILGEFTFMGEGRVSGLISITKKSSKGKLLGDEVVDTKFSQILSPSELVDIMDKYQEI